MQDKDRLQVLLNIDSIMKKVMDIQYMASLLYKLKDEIIEYDFYEDLDLILEDFDYDEQRLLVHILALMNSWQKQAIHNTSNPRFH